MVKKFKENDFAKKMLIVIFVIIVFFGVSYAAFTYSREGQNQNVATTGRFNLTLDDTTSNGISMENTVPISDAEGLVTTPYTFTVENTGTIKAQYRVKIIEDTEKYNADGCNNNKMPTTVIKYGLQKNTQNLPTALLSSTSSGQIDVGLLAPGEKNTYTLRLWITSEATNEIMGTHFHGKLQVQAIQEGHTNYDTGE